jgi:hypothetical protein
MAEKHGKLPSVAAAEIGGRVGALKNDKDAFLLVGSPREDGSEEEKEEEEKRPETGSLHVAAVKITLFAIHKQTCPERPALRMFLAVLHSLWQVSPVAERTWDPFRL